MENRSSKNAWILGVSIIFVAFLGVGAGIGLSFLNGSEDTIPNLSFNPVIGDVSLADRECCIVRDTIEGWVDIDIDIYCEEDLPLCLNADYINEMWSASAAVCGYDLEYSYITICQKGEIKGYVLVDWEVVCRERCWTDYYTGTFTLLDACGNPVDYIALDSSYWPDGAEPIVDTDSELIPGKEVYLVERHLLTGCEQECQHFWMNGDITEKLVKKGWIEVCYNIPDPMDLCLTSEDLADWTGTMYISGYEPVDGVIYLWQKDEYLGKVFVEWTFVEQVPCYYDIYTATFTMEADYIAIYSNQWPAGSEPCSDAETIPDKEVILCPVNLYKGCDEDNQKFLKIMALEIRVSGVPNS